MPRFGGTLDEVTDSPKAPRFSGVEEKKPRFGGAEKTVTDNILDSFVYAGKNLKHGYQSGAEYMYNVAANIPMMIHDTSNYLAEKTGGIPSDETVAKTIETWIRNEAKGISPPEDQAPESIIGKIYAGIGAAPATIATFLPAVKGAGAVAGMAATEAVAAADQGPSAALEAGAKGALMGGTLKAGEPLTRAARMPLMGAVGATQAAAEGGDVADVVSGGIVMGGLGAMGQKGGTKLKELLPEKPAVAPVTEKPISSKTEPTVNDYATAEAKAKEFAGNINLSKITAPDTVKQLLKDTAKEHDNFMGARRGVVSHEATMKAARDHGLTVDEFIARKGRGVTESEALAGRLLMVKSADTVVALREKAVSGSDVDMLAFQEALTRHVAIQEAAAGETATAGRVLNQYKIQAATEKAQLDAIKNLIDANGGREQIEAVAKALTDPKNLGDFNQLAAKLVRPKPIDMVIEAWINGLLSGPQTHAVNMTSNAVVALLDIPQTAIAATLGTFRKGPDKVRYGEVLAKTYGFVEGSKVGAIRMVDTLRTGEPTDPLSKLESAKYKSIPGKLGEVVRTPGRFLMAEDEFFKAIGYRMDLNAQAFRVATNEGLKGRDLAKRIEELKISPTEKMHDQATEKARYQTFTKELGPTGKNVQKLAAENVYIKFLAPFIRTPTNIVKYAGERTAFSLVSKAVRTEMAKGGAARDEQIAKIAMGSMISTATAALVQQGLVTGGGSSDPRQRAAEYAAGRPPYSVLIGDQYHSYSRIEPFGMLMGITADMAEIMGQAKGDDVEKMPAMLAASIAKNITSKTYLKGLSETFKMFDNPERYGERWIQGYAGTLVPSIVSQTAKVIDPVLRETTTNLEKIKSRIPIISRSLTPRHTLWGEEIVLEGGFGPDIISPIYQSTKSNDKLLNEVADLKIAPSMPKKKLFGIELTTEQYAEYVVEAGKSAKRVLDTLVNKVSWDYRPDHQKIEIIEGVIRKQRQAARSKILAKYPDLIEEHIDKSLEQALPE